jgi:inorganic pyrophosphatase
VNNWKPTTKIFPRAKRFQYEVIAQVKAVDRKSGNLNVVIDTPKGSRNKYAFDFKINAYKLKAVLPSWHDLSVRFWINTGHNRGRTANPLDVLVLMDEPGVYRCLIEARLLGVIEAQQTEDGQDAT